MLYIIVFLDLKSTQGNDCKSIFLQKRHGPYSMYTSTEGREAGSWDVIVYLMYWFTSLPGPN